ncbi:formylglycine-generating enzyme family protein [Arvimicrobium flavum]|uniref:formylglycine-generating enzyme family protein n=1 Tax=Arvimicrobium flavum TaxID=3393320 RepID=UPI00398CCA2F
MACCNPGRSAVDRPQEQISASASLEAESHPEMARIPAGRWLLGEDRSFAHPDDGEGPVRRVDLPAFLIDRTAVTNEAFALFVDATGYVTEAERLGWSFVFTAQAHPDAAIAAAADAQAPDWWLPVRGACWHAPDGEGSSLHALHDHPVVHVSWNDAAAFAGFVGKRLPTEAEWEAAARGGLQRAIYAWGDALHPGGRHMCNIWQGRFPLNNTADDGYLATAPARSFPPNGFGLYNMLGNVWEWTASPWSRETPGLMAMRGGSYLCHASYCDRYRVSARTCNHLGATSSHLGFRCAGDLQTNLSPSVA